MADGEDMEDKKTNWRRKTLPLQYFFVISFISMVIYEPSVLFLWSFKDGTILGALLGGFFAFGALGLVGYALGKRSLKAFYSVSFIVFVLTSTQALIESNG